MAPCTVHGWYYSASSKLVLQIRWLDFTWPCAIPRAASVFQLLFPQARSLGRMSVCLLVSDAAFINKVSRRGIASAVHRFVSCHVMQ